jgi:hypothetical protein
MHAFVDRDARPRDLAPAGSDDDGENLLAGVACSRIPAGQMTAKKCARDIRKEGSRCAIHTGAFTT